MGYRTILAGTDGSDTATAALRTAARVAKRCRADLLIACAFEPFQLAALIASATSRSASLTFSSEIFPSPRRFLNAFWSLLESESNICST